MRLRACVGSPEPWLFTDVTSIKITCTSSFVSAYEKMQLIEYELWHALSIFAKLSSVARCLHYVMDLHLSTLILCVGTQKTGVPCISSPDVLAP